MARENTFPGRITKELDELIKEVMKKNNLTRRQAANAIAKAGKFKIKNKKIRISEDIIF